MSGSHAGRTTKDQKLVGGASSEVIAAEVAATLRSVFGHLPTGITVISAFSSAGSPVGVTCNSFTSVSLHPALVSFCPARSSRTWPTIRESGHFCVNILARQHGSLTRTFAAAGTDRFAGVDWHPRAAGPGIDDALAWIDCSIDRVLDGGDHLIVIGCVLELAAGPAADAVQPLIFHRGRLGTFAAGPHPMDRRAKEREWT